MGKKRRKKTTPRKRYENVEPVSHKDKVDLKRKRPTPIGVTSSHKARSEWFRDRAAWPLREAPAEALLREKRRAARQLPRHPAAENKWSLIGPTNVGGRMTAVAVDPNDADRVWAGAAGGGVWRSTDAGVTWKALWHKQQSLNIGSIAVDPNDAEVLYCGTGEANLSADSYPGVGLYRSQNGGSSWKLIARAKTDGIPARIGAIAVDPFDSDHLLIGGVGHRFPNEPETGGLGGIYESTDGGATWQRLTFTSEHEHRCHAIVFHPGKQGWIYATIAEQGMRNGVWRSKDAGTTWEHLTAGLPSPELMERTSLAIAPSDPSVLYAISADREHGVRGVFRSANEGDVWSSIHGNHFRNERQMSYNNTIVVHPDDPDHVICGGVDLHRTTNGGTNWERVTRWDLERGHPKHAHADHHALAMPASDPGRVYSLNDGGMDVSFDGGTTWENRSTGLAVTMYYDLDVAQSNSQFFGGGAQDNGTPITTSGSPDDHFDITGGDGGWLVFDPSNELHIFSSIYNMNIFRFTAQRGWVDVSPPELGFLKQSVWMVYIAMDPAKPKTVFTGSRRIWRTKNDGNSWKAVSGFFAGVVSAIEVSRADSKRVYAGTSHGEIFRSLDGGNSWSGNISSADLPNFSVTRLRTSPDDADRVIATVANFGASHVFRSLDGGLTWEDIHGDLPRVPFSGIAIPADHPDEVYVAGDAGIYVSEDFGDTWSELTGNLPNVSFVDLVYHNADATLTAATYGRGIWQVQVR